MAGLDWFDDGNVAGCPYPRDERALAALAREGVSLLINLHERSHDPWLLARLKLAELHLPVVDFTAPTPDQLEQGVAAIDRAVAEGKKVMVHCAMGLGRTGTLLACYLVHRGHAPEDAIAIVRAARPGSVETPEQVHAVERYAEAHGRS
jgi:atypical dual specificity phosphatase